MQNNEGKNVDLYIPRKWYVLPLPPPLSSSRGPPCPTLLLATWKRDGQRRHRTVIPLTNASLALHSSATNRLITPKDHAAVQINIGHVDANGVYTGKSTTFALSGFIRNMGEADFALSRLASDANLMPAL